MNKYVMSLCFLLVLFNNSCLAQSSDIVNEYKLRQSELAKRKNSYEQNRVMPTNKNINQNNGVSQSEINNLEITNLRAQKAGLPTITEIQEYYDKHGTVPPAVFEYNKKVMNSIKKWLLILI